MLVPHALGYLVSRLLADQLGQQLVGEGEGSGRTLARGDVAVDGAEVTGIVGTILGQRLLEAGIARGALAVEDAQGSEDNSRRGTDGCHLLAGSDLVDDGLAYALVGIEVAGSRHAARQEQQVSVGEVTLLEHDVCLDAHTVGRLHQWEVSDTDCRNVHTSATPHVNGYQGLDILEAVS